MKIMQNIKSLMLNRFALLMLAVCAIAIVSCDKAKEAKPISKEISKEITNSEAKIVFYEFGSDKCIPCKQMKTVCDNITAKYGKQLEFKFFDVNKEDEASEKYKIQLIPTQVFMDKAGNEFYRHTGYLSEQTIDSILQSKGLKI